MFVPRPRDSVLFWHNHFPDTLLVFGNAICAVWGGCPDTTHTYDIALVEYNAHRDCHP